jgi:hypothetical protein
MSKTTISLNNVPDRTAGDDIKESRADVGVVHNIGMLKKASNNNDEEENTSGSNSTRNTFFCCPLLFGRDNRKISTVDSIETAKKRRGSSIKKFEMKDREVLEKEGEGDLYNGNNTEKEENKRRYCTRENSKVQFNV